VFRKQRAVRSDLVVVVRPRGYDAGLTYDRNMIEALAPDRSYEPFDMTILPRRAWRGWMVTNPHGLQSTTVDCP
jgi:hypothetical protein